MNDIPSSLSIIDESNHGRVKKVRDMKSLGYKIIGYQCALIPVEIMSAFDVVPYKICSDIKEPITEADRLLATASCPVMRSCLDCALKGRDDFLDGLVTTHSSDPGEKAARTLGAYTNYPYFHFIDMPGTVRPEAITYFKTQISDFAKTMASFTGKRLSTEKLNIAIELHNRQRSLVQELYALTRPVPPLISGTEIVKIVRTLMTLPVQEGNNLLVQVIDEVKKRGKGPAQKRARLLIWSSTLDDPGIMQMFEEQSNVVYDETCGGIRPFRSSVKVTADPLDGLAAYYLKEITCARTFRQASLGEIEKNYSEDLRSRFGYLKQVVEKWKIDGVILLLVRYCDPFAFEIPSIKDYFSNLSVRSTYIEYDYSERALAPLRTRIEAFIDTIS
ncbi:MAG: 2-hydroxyacyl-CoA dehydratase family protein [Dehalococcoidia bacterium]